MNDSMRVQVFHSIAELYDIALDFKLNKSLSPSEEFIERLTLAQLQYDIDIISILKEMLKPYCTRMM